MSYDTAPSPFERYLKMAFIAGGALVAFVFLYSYVSQNARRSSATLGPESVKIEFSDVASTAGMTANQRAIGVSISPVDTTKKLSAFDLRLDATNLKIVSSTDPVGFDDRLFQTITDSKIRATYTVGLTAVMQDLAFFTILVESTGAASGTLTVDRTNTEIVGSIEKIEFDLDTDPIVKTVAFDATNPPPVNPPPVNPPPVNPPPVNPPPTSGGSAATLNIKVRLQGVLTKPNLAGAETFNIWLKGPTDISGSVVLTPDASGVYAGTTSISVDPGTYMVFVKGPRHLKKRICDSSPGETSIGTYRCSEGKINITGGTNDLDFSGITLLAGDLPAQDGIVDSYDTSFVRQSLGSSDGSKVAIGDINRDGIVDTQDMSLIIQSLNIKYDEE